MSRIATYSLFVFFLLTAGGADLHAQPTFDAVYAILQTNCSNATCHNGGTGVVNFSGTKSLVYDRLVNVAPLNPTAAAKGHKLVDPGYPERSFLFRKISHPGFDDYYALDDPDEGAYMPQDAPALADKDIELIRQWVLYGAEINKAYVDPTVIADFYDGQGKSRIATPAAPAAGEGFQVRLGPFFLDSQEEKEYFKKQDVRFSSDQEIKRIEVFFNDEAHHFIIYKMGPAAADDYDEGLRDINDGATDMLSNNIVAAWQDAMNIELPPTTAYFWDAGTVLDLNFHLRNYDPDSILASEVFINIYTQPKGTADQEMISQLIPIDIIDFLFGTGEVGNSLIIPNNGQEVVFSEGVALPFTDETWHLWLLSTHTHARGTDYDIYMRNPNGSRGEQIFEGFYNFNYTFNQGFYDWEHPPVRYFDPLKPVNMNQFAGGLIHEAKYVNTGPDTLYWGNTTEDEMMLFFIQYTLAPLAATSLDTELAQRAALQVYPNPAAGETGISYTLDRAATVEVALFDMTGKRLQVLADGPQLPGLHRHTFSRTANRLPAGVYFVRLTLDGMAAGFQKMVFID